MSRSAAGPPAGHAAASRAASGSAKPASGRPGGLGGQVGGPVRVGPGASGRVGRVGGGGQRVGRRAVTGQDRVQVRRAVELGGQRLAVPGGPLVGLDGLAQFGAAVIGQLDQPLVRGGDVPVQVVQGRLRIGQPGRRQPFGFGLELITGRGEPSGLGR